MIYEYRCNTCGTLTEVIKSVREIDNAEPCKKCNTPMIRAFAPRRVHLSGTSVQEKKWQPTLGRPATDNEMRQEARNKGWIEMGNEDPHKHLEPPTAEYPTFSDDDIAAISRSQN